MRKFISMALAASMAASMAVPAFAAGGSQSKGTDVVYSVNEDYVWTIPSEITPAATEASANAGSQIKGQESTLSVTKNTIAFGKKLQIKVNGADYAVDGDWRMKDQAENAYNADDEASFITYEILTSWGDVAGGTSVASGDVVYEQVSGQDTGSAYINFYSGQLEKANLRGGNYKDQITFDADIVNVA